MNSDISKFQSLCYFIRGEADGSCWKDVTYRAYDLDKLTGANTVKKALNVIGRNAVSELADDLRCINLLPAEGATGALCRWYVWYRLGTGIIARWPLRPSKDRATFPLPDLPCRHLDESADRGGPDFRG